MLGSTDLEKGGASQRFASLRSSQPEFEEAFLSDKLDLVFVLDTSPAMEVFYKTNLFGPEFLNRFQTYDWQFAWTDMSVDVQSLTQKEEAEREIGKKKPKENEESCGLFKGLGLTVVGILGGHPLMTGFGIDAVADCMSFQRKKEKESVNIFTNGSFLPFEYKGQKIEPQGFSRLNASFENYSAVFDHSMRIGNEKGKKSSYESPEQRETAPYPFLSMALSMARGAQTPENPQAGEELSFFRDDSLIVYVLVTVQDMQAHVSAKKFNESVESFFGSEKRVQLIPVTLSPESSLLCGLKAQSQSEGSRKLRNLAKKLGNTPIDICSKQLGDELFREISKSLYPVGFLSE